MSNKLYIQPPEIVDVGDSPVIFLAGPIQGAPNWQPHAGELIHDIDPSVVVASPRKEYLDGTFDYGKQVDWETHFLRAAGERGVVAFWLAKEVEKIPGRDYAQTTRFELAEWKVRHERDGSKLAVGIEPGFAGERYIRRRFGQDCPNVTITDSLAKMCANAVSLLPRNSSNR